MRGVLIIATAAIAKPCQWPLSAHRNLREALERRDAARRLPANGVAPGVARQGQKAARLAQAASSLEAVGREWVAQDTRLEIPSLAGWDFLPVFPVLAQVRSLSYVDAHSLASADRAQNARKIRG